MSKVYIPSNANIGNGQSFNQKACNQHRANKNRLTIVSIASMIALVIGAYMFAVAVVNSF